MAFMPALAIAAAVSKYVKASAASVLVFVNLISTLAWCCNSFCASHTAGNYLRLLVATNTWPTGSLVQWGVNWYGAGVQFLFSVSITWLRILSDLA